MQSPMQMWTVLLDILLLLGAAMVLGAVFARLRQSAIVGYLLAGTLLGPHALGYVKTGGEIEAIAELGVALLLFSLGLEFSWRRLVSFGPKALVGGSLQIVLTMLLAAAAALILGQGARPAVAIGAIIALSSTACVLRVLMDRSETDSVHGRSALGVLLLQDVAVVPLAVLVSVLAGEATMSAIALDLLGTLLQALGLMAALWLVLNYAAVWLFGTHTLSRNRELAILLAVIVSLGSAWAAHAVNLSPALGAFVAGILLGGSPFAAQIRADIGALRVVLLTLFFSVAGMIADPAWMLENWLLLVAVVAVLVAGKSLIVWIILRLFGQSHAHALAAGLCLAQVGEFSFVLLNLGRHSVLSEHLFHLLGAATILSLLLTPYLVAYGPRLAAAVDRRLSARRRAATTTSERPPSGASDAEPTSAGPRVVIIGFGPAGQAVARALQPLATAVTVLDLNPRVGQLAQPFGYASHVGDASHVELLEEAHVSRAAVVVVTLPDPQAVQQVVQSVRRVAPQAYVIARVRYHIARWQVELAGAQSVVDEEYEVGRSLATQVRRHLRAASAPAPVTWPSAAPS